MNLKSNKFDSILDKIIIIGFTIYALGSILSMAAMNIGLGLALLGWLIKKAKNLDFKLADTPYNKVIIFFLLAVAFSFIDSLNLANSLDYFKRYWLPILLFYILVDLNPNFKIIKRWLGIIFIIMIGSIVYSFWQYQMGVSRVNASNFVMEFAGLLVFMAAYTVTYALWGDIQLRKKIFLGVISLSTIIALLFTQTRGAWIALLGSLATIFFIKNRKYLIYFLIITSIFLLLAPNFLPDRYINRFVSIFDIKNNGSNVTRINLWRGALLIYRDHWVNGIGLNNFKDVIGKKKYYKKPMVSRKHAHNNFLQLAAETGTVGLFSFILLFGVILKRLYHLFNQYKDKNLKLFFLANLGMVIGYLSHGLTEYTLEDKYTTRLLWFIIAITVILVKEVKNTDEKISF